MPTINEPLALENAAGGVTVHRTVQRLRRYVWLERACIRAVAAWFLRMPAYEDKISMGHHLWAHAERVEGWRRRLAELRGGHHEANLEPGIQQVADEMIHAPDERSFLTGWGIIVSHLIDAYREHRRDADSSANASEIRLLRQVIADAELTGEWIAQTLPRHRGQSDSQAGQWADYVNQLLAQAGGVGGLDPQPAVKATRPHGSRYERPRTLIFDDRIKSAPFDSYDRRMDLPFEQCRLAECEIYFNEFYAAALLATILLDAWNVDAPWDFFHDLCHHFWDEVRHAEFGMIRLKELGVEPSRVNLMLFEAANNQPFLHRLCYLTLGLEIYFMPRKRPRVKRYEAAGDPRTQLFADVDWSDEGNHVQYGKRWVAHFLEDDARSVEELQDEIAENIKRAGIELPEGQLAPY